MSCEKFSDLIMKFFDGNISSKDDECLKQHINSCAGCRAEFNSLNEIFNCYEEDITVEPPEGFEASVMKRVKEYDDLKRKKVDRNLMIVYGATFVVMGIISMIVLMFLKNGAFPGSPVKSGGVEDAFWGVAFFAYNMVINVYLYIKANISSYASYYLFAICLIFYLVIQKSIVERANVKKAPQPTEPN
ncbi:anti-sigma factor family protein [Pseudobacteroides cellulosolvens]|uniref:Putative zinc-finger domain-containing protein n=1 Tax=Pseudobacteroides cellulosolvens ATCC 35603 = DSM 2933 TaxID=398512 RepID=A0A0L6JTH7_9FIRM|nr:zf-HC2 domain-containing protein [Pseudobacteroides cellulosolvens]KNY29123.1 hypothetical protein Bccel_4397 [Pseudobacteroides cellulosolvens ATCC 35603 = DSM 2933]